MPATQASAGYCQNGARQNASRLRKQPEVRERNKELTANFAAAAMAGAISDKNARMRDYDKRWKRLRSAWDRLLAE